MPLASYLFQLLSVSLHSTTWLPQPPVTLTQPQPPLTATTYHISNHSLFPPLPLSLAIDSPLSRATTTTTGTTSASTLRPKAAVAALVASQDVFDVVVTDMNSGGWGEGAAEMLARAASAGIASDGAVLVMTLKGCEKASVAQLTKHISACTSVLEAGGFTSVRCVHLMSNTPWERTIVAVWSTLRK
jgi:pyrimidine deaminase RibD-like protein